jgi:hypothetical protein
MKAYRPFFARSYNLQLIKPASYQRLIITFKAWLVEPDYMQESNPDGPAFAATTFKAQHDILTAKGKLNPHTKILDSNPNPRHLR